MAKEESLISRLLNYRWGKEEIDISEAELISIPDEQLPPVYKDGRPYYIINNQYMPYYSGLLVMYKKQLILLEQKIITAGKKAEIEKKEYAEADKKKVEREAIFAKEQKRKEEEANKLEYEKLKASGVYKDRAREMVWGK